MKGVHRFLIAVLASVIVGSGLVVLGTGPLVGPSQAQEGGDYHYAITFVRRLMNDFPGRQTYYVTGETGRFETIVYVPGQGPVDGLSLTWRAFDRLGNPDYEIPMEGRGSGVYWATFTVTSAWNTPGKYSPRLFVGSQEVVPDWQYTLWANALDIEAAANPIEGSPGSLITVTGRLHYVFVEGRPNPFETQPNPRAEIVQSEISAVDGMPPHVEGTLRSPVGAAVATASTDTYLPGAGFTLAFAVPATASPGKYTVHLTATKTNPSGGSNRLTTTPTYGESRETTVFIGVPRELYVVGDLQTFIVSGPVLNTEAGGFPTPLPVEFVATAVGPHSVVWVEFDAARSGPAESIPAEVSTIFRNEFEVRDFPNEVYGTFHGETWNGLFGVPQDVDAEVHVHLLYFNIGLIYPQCPGCFFVGGFFFPLGSQINGKDLLHQNRFHDAPQHAPSTVAHEFQHMITENEDNGEPTWVNEGLSDVAIMVTYGIGGVAGHVSSYVGNSDVGLTEWGHTIITADYGAAYLFMQYLIDHFDPRTTGRYPAGDRPDRIITELVANPSDSGDGVTDTLAGAGFPFTFRQVFENWALANFVDDPGFPTQATEGYPAAYGYAAFRVRSFGAFAIQASRTTYPFGPEDHDVEAWGTEYVSLRAGGASGTLNVFVEEIPNVSVTPHSGAHAWWSNDAGTDTHFMLQQDISLIGTTAPRLSFFLYHNTEPGFDFGFVEASGDGGSTFDPLLVINGWSGGEFLPFVTDLTPYADGIVRLRFRYTQDTGNGARFTPGLPGLLLDDVEITDGAARVFFDDMETPGGWETPGGESPTPGVPAAPWVFYPSSSRTLLVQAVALSGDVRQGVTSFETPGELTVAGFGSAVTEVVLAVSMRIDTYPESPYAINGTFRYSGRILETSAAQVTVGRSAAAVAGDARFPISGNRVAPGQGIEMTFDVSVTRAPVDSFELVETAPASWNPVPSVGGADSVGVTLAAGSATIRWAWSRIPAESSSSVSYRATAPAAEGSYGFGPATWTYRETGGFSGSGAEPAPYVLVVDGDAERLFSVTAAGSAYTIPSKHPVWPVSVDLTWRRVSQDATTVFFAVSGRVTVHTSEGDDVFVVTSGSGIFDRTSGEVDIHARTNRGSKLVLTGTADWTGDGSGTVSFSVWGSKITSRYFLDASGAIGG